MLQEECLSDLELLVHQFSALVELDLQQGIEAATNLTWSTAKFSKCLHCISIILLSMTVEAFAD